MDDGMDRGSLSLTILIGTGITTVALGSALAFALLDTNRRRKAAASSLMNGDTSSSSVTLNENGHAASSASESEEIGESSNKKLDGEKYPGGQITVYYATQTGTAESFARQLEREGAEHGFLVHVMDLEEVELESLLQTAYKDDENDKAAAVKSIFLSSTYGEGEPPDTAATFVHSLQAKAHMESLLSVGEKADKSVVVSEEDRVLKGLDYCVFGLGNKQYEHFNAMGKFFDHALERAGAARVMPVGLGDEDEDIEADFENWKERMWKSFEQKYVSNVDSIVFKERSFNAAAFEKASLPDCPYVVEYHTSEEKLHRMNTTEAHHAGRTSNTAVRHAIDSVAVPVTAVRELRSPDDGGSTVHVEVDISGTDVHYQTADNLGVLPVNDSSLVEAVANRLGYDLDQLFSLKGAPSHDWHGAPFPQPLTIRDCLSLYCDLTGPPRRSDLKLLAEYAKDPTDKKALQRMASKDGRTEYKEKIMESYYGLADVLKLCPSIEMPLEHFLNVCPQLQTRFFTISSSSSVHPTSVHLTVAVAKHQRKDGSVFKGVCSNYLAERKAKQETVRVFNRPSTFRLPEDASKPIIMIGPGTGIAPMRALLQERAYQRTKLNKKVGSNILYFGCKKRTHDFLYQDELKHFQESGDLTKLHLAFSREQTEKVYVQNVLQKNASDTWTLMEQQGAYVYVCGGVKMGHDVSEALKEIVMNHGKVDAEKAKDYLAKMAKEGRYVQELWA